MPASDCALSMSVYAIAELLNAVHSEVVGNLGISCSQCAGYEEQLPHPFVVCKQGEMKSERARLEVPFRETAF